MTEAQAPSSPPKPRRASRPFDAREDWGLLAGAGLAAASLAPGTRTFFPEFRPSFVGPNLAGVNPGSPNLALPEGIRAALDAQWCVVAKGEYLSEPQLREGMRDGPLSFAWLGSQEGPGLFQPGPWMTPGTALMRPDRRFRAASARCPHDRAPITYDADLDQWRCLTCTSRFAGRTGSVVEGPAPKPLLTFFLRRLSESGRVALVPPSAKPPA